MNHPTPQHKDTTLDEILRLLSGTSYDIAAENRNVGELLEAETKAKQAIIDLVLNDVIGDDSDTPNVMIAMEHERQRAIIKGNPQ